ncbi:MAG: HEAT repeat domain-containing protein [Leptospirales bacterium]|nr:HEAT repeat domain-containing protein [Leptospirales bacterium]
MKKLLLTVTTIFFAVSLFAADKTAEQYIADLDPANDAQVIITAADWLGKNKHEKAIEKLLPLLGDSREGVRLRAVTALGNIGKEDAIEGINKSLVTDESADVRYAAALATVIIASPKSIPAWKEARDKETDPYIRDFLTKMKEKVEK